MSGRYLVDAMILLNAWHKPQRLQKKHREVIESDSDLHVSLVTIWEISIKAAIGKLDTVDNVAEAVIATGYKLLPITAPHVEAVRHLPLHHRDPFDRLLVTQAKLEDLTLMTTDAHLRHYGVPIC